MNTITPSGTSPKELAALWRSPLMRGMALAFLADGLRRLLLVPFFIIVTWNAIIVPASGGVWPWLRLADDLVVLAGWLILLVVRRQRFSPAAAALVSPGMATTATATVASAPAKAVTALLGAPGCPVCKGRSLVAAHGHLVRNQSVLALWSPDPDGDGLLVDGGDLIDLDGAFRAMVKEPIRPLDSVISCLNCNLEWPDLADLARAWRQAETPGFARRLGR